MNLGDYIKKHGLDPGTKEKVFLQFEDEKITFGEYLDQSTRYANLFLQMTTNKRGPFHVGVLMENYPEFLYAFGGCALIGATLVGVNTAQKGSNISRDINYCDCQLLLTENKFLDEISPIFSEFQIIRKGEILVNNKRESDKSLPEGFASLEEKLREIEAQIGAAAFKTVPVFEFPETTNQMIIFTSGSTGAPKGVMNSHKKFIEQSEKFRMLINYDTKDVGYGVMPFFHSNTTYLSTIPALVYGGGMGFRRKFSASGFLPDIRKFGCTIFNYVGKPLAYVLSTPERPDDHENPLRIALGNGASSEDQEIFRTRFGLDWVMEVYGATEGGVTTMRLPGDPPGSVGAIAPEYKVIKEDGKEAAPARFDEHGLLLNYRDAVGEIINTGGIGGFEGYYKNPEASAKKAEGNMFHTGDLAYYRVLEKDGIPTRFMYFVGRTDDWIRKDGENFLADPIEEIVNRYGPIFLTSAYGVPCWQSDEHVMISVMLKEGRSFDPQEFYSFLLKQKDMSPKWHPDYIRVLKQLPQTETVKILRREVKREFFNREVIEDPIYWRERDEQGYKLFTKSDYEDLKEKFVKAGRANDLVRG